MKSTHRSSKESQAEDYVDDGRHDENEYPGDHHGLVVLLSKVEKEKEEISQVSASRSSCESRL